MDNTGSAFLQSEARGTEALPELRLFSETQLTRDMIVRVESVRWPLILGTCFPLRLGQWTLSAVVSAKSDKIAVRIESRAWSPRQHLVRSRLDRKSLHLFGRVTLIEFSIVTRKPSPGVEGGFRWAFLSLVWQGHARRVPDTFIFNTPRVSMTCIIPNKYL